MPVAAESGAFEALGDAHRREILRLLGEGDLSVQEIASELPISRPAVSRHLKLLGEAGLVSSEPRGTRQIYSLREEGMVAVQAYLERVWGEAATRFRLMAQNTERTDIERTDTERTDTERTDIDRTADAGSAT